MSKSFQEMHMGEAPLVLFNVWDAGSAMAVQKAGATALATSSWAVAASLGLKDGEALSFERLLARIEEIAQVATVPLSVDMEAGYAEGLDQLAGNIQALQALGVVGINIEDGLIGQGGLRAVSDQQARIAAIRETAGADFFINARSDVFFGAAKELSSEAQLAEAIARAKAYEAAGASGVFLPGLLDAETWQQIHAEVDLPLNAMWLEAGTDGIAPLVAAGVRRISTGPAPYLAAQAAVKNGAKAMLGALS